MTHKSLKSILAAADLTPKDRHSLSEKAETMLAIKDAAVNYGESKILRSVNLQVPPGQVICLMGRNGVGKTTMMKRGEKLRHENRRLPLNFHRL